MVKFTFNPLSDGDTWCENLSVTGSIYYPTPLLITAEMMYEAQISRQTCTVGRKLNQPFLVLGIMYVGDKNLNSVLN